MMMMFAAHCDEMSRTLAACCDHHDKRVSAIYCYEMLRKLTTHCGVEPFCFCHNTAPSIRRMFFYDTVKKRFVKNFQVLTLVLRRVFHTADQKEASHSRGTSSEESRPIGPSFDGGTNSGGGGSVHGAPSFHTMSGASTEGLNPSGEVPGVRFVLTCCCERAGIRL